MSNREKRLSTAKVVYNEDSSSENESDYDDEDVKIDKKSNEKNKTLKKQRVEDKVKKEKFKKAVDDGKNKKDSNKNLNIKVELKVKKKKPNKKIADEDNEDDFDNEDSDEEEEKPKRKRGSIDEEDSDNDDEDDGFSSKKNYKVKRKTNHSDNSNIKLEIGKEEPGKSIFKSKQLGKLERLEEARQAYKWWEAEELPDDLQWRKLEHTGLIFPPKYVRHNVPFLYDGKVIELTDEQEEMVTFYAAMPDDGPQLGNPKTRKVFQDNFFESFKSMLNSGHVIKKFDKCDFNRIREHLELQKNLRKAATNEEKSLKKADKDLEAQRQGFALIDGRIEKVILHEYYNHIFIIFLFIYIVDG